MAMQNSNNRSNSTKKNALLSLNLAFSKEKVQIQRVVGLISLLLKKTTTFLSFNPRESVDYFHTTYPY